MQVEGLKITREEAEMKLQDYTSAQRKRLTEMDRALYKGYKAIAEGAMVIDVNEVIKAGGVFEDIWAPKIAIVRSDRKTVYFDWNYNASERVGVFQGYDAFEDLTDLAKQSGLSENSDTWEWRDSVGLRIELPIGTMPEPVCNTRAKEFKDKKRTLVPEIPIQYRPAKPENYFVLWEVDEWAPVAPVDPYLLERIAHPIYVVVAQWDLTELERKILESFRSRS